MKALNLIIVTLLILVSNNLFSQKRPPQDVRKVTVTSQYEIVNGQKTDKMWTVYQEIYDSLGRLHTEIEYGINDHYPHKFKWHTYIGKQVVRSDYFDNEKLKLIKTFTYDKDSLISNEVIKFVKPDDTTIYTILSYKYNQLHKPVLIEATGVNGKTAYKSKSTYDLKGTELSRSVSIKKGYFPLDSIITLSCKPSYDSIGRLVENVISTTKTNGNKTKETFKYTYDKKNNIIEVTLFDRYGKQISRQTRIFQPSRNRLVVLKYYDSNDKLVKWLEKRFEIYRTKDRRNMEIDY